MYFIQEDDKPNFISDLFSIPRLEKNKIYLPIVNTNHYIIDSKKDISEKQKQGPTKIQEKRKKQKFQKEKEIRKQLKLAQKTQKILEKTHCKKIILSKKLQEKEVFCNKLYTYGFETIDGRWLFRVLSSEIANYITEKNNMIKEKTTVSILINDLTDIILENIKHIVKKYKRVNIVTNHIEKFKKIEEQILEDYGIMITINNNKKKSLAGTDIILNVDFPTELINKYRIEEKAIIVNLRGNVKITQKRFNGQNFNDYEIKYCNDEEFDYEINEKYYMKDVYEAMIYKQQPIENIMKKVKKDKVKIIQLK